MKKLELRKKYLEMRKTLSADEVLLLSEKIYENFILQFNVIENQNVHVFLPIEKFNEIGTNFFLEYFWSKNVNVFVPKVKAGEMISVRLSKNTKLEKSSWGILEPISNENECSYFDYVITPLLYCDKSGNRIGYGKGFYDNFLSKCKPETIKIGLSFFPPEEKIEDVSTNDVKLDFCVTPEGIFEF